MVISGVVPFTIGAKDGTLQKMIKTNKKDYIKLVSSSTNTQDNQNYPELILQDDDNYFCTETKTGNEVNHLIIELVDRAIYVNGYVIRSDSYGYLKSWKLYGSMGGSDWNELHSRTNVADLANNQYQSYKIKGGPYRMFKILQTGVASGTSDKEKYRERIKYIDIFGFMPPKYLCTFKQSLRRVSNLFCFTQFLITR